jgi:hypothetical protein
MNMECAYRDSTRRLVVLATAALLSGSALAQQPSAATPPDTAPGKATRSAPAPADLEPGVDTSKSTATAAPAAPAAVTPPASAASAATSKAATKSAAAGAAAAQGGGKPAAGAAPRQGAANGKGARPDRLELDTTDITGNRELPKVLYIVPWKRSDLGDLVGRPTHSLLDEVLQPLDRDVFQRQNRYYDALKPGEDAAKAGAAPSSDAKP